MSTDALFNNVQFLLKGDEDILGDTPGGFGIGFTTDTNALVATDDYSAWGGQAYKLVGDTNDTISIVGAALTEWTVDIYLSGELGNPIGTSDIFKQFTIVDSGAVNIDAGIDTSFTPHRLRLAYTNTATGFSSNATVVLPDDQMNLVQVQRTNGAAGRRLSAYLNGVRFLDVAYANTLSYTPLVTGVKLWDVDGRGFVFDELRLTDVARYVDSNGDALAGPLTAPTEGWPIEAPPPPVESATAVLIGPAGRLTAYGGGAAVLTGPAGTVHSTASRIPLQGGAFVGPAGTVSASGGGGAALTGPVGALTSTATSHIVGLAELVGPAGVLTASASSTVVGSAVLTGPAGTARASGGGGAVLVGPAGVLQAGASMGYLATAVLHGPAGHLTATASRMNVGYAVLMGPAGYLVQPNTAVLTGPAGHLVATASRVVTLVYEGYAVNLNPTGSPKDPPVNEATRYTRSPFEALVRFNGETLGLGPAGIHRIGGDSDAGAAIAGEAMPVLNDWGTPGMKRPEYVYLGGRITNGLRVKLRAIGERGEALAYDYANDARGPDIQNHRQKLGRGLRTRYLAFGIGDPTGGAFMVDSLEPEFADLTRRVSSTRS